MKLKLRNAKHPLVKVDRGFGYYGAITTDETGDLVQCHICGKMFEQLQFHLKFGHKTTVADYKKEFKLSYSDKLLGESTRVKLINQYLQKGRSKGLEALKKYQEDLKSGKRVHPATRYKKRSLADFNKRDVCPEQMLFKIKRLGKMLGHAPSMADFKREYGHTAEPAKTHFGSYREAVKKAGFEPLPVGSIKGTRVQYKDDEIIKAMQNFFIKYGRTPRTSDFESGIDGLPGVHIIYNRYGTLTKARAKAKIPNTQYMGSGIWIEVKQ